MVAPTVNRVQDALSHKILVPWNSFHNKPPLFLMTPVFDLPNHLILLQIVCYPHPIVKNSQEFSVKS